MKKYNFALGLFLFISFFSRFSFHISSEIISIILFVFSSTVFVTIFLCDNQLVLYSSLEKFVHHLQHQLFFFNGTWQDLAKCQHSGTMRPIRTNGTTVVVTNRPQLCLIVLYFQRDSSVSSPGGKNLLLSSNVLLALLTFQTAVVIHLPLECV